MGLGRIYSTSLSSYRAKALDNNHLSHRFFFVCFFFLCSSTTTFSIGFCIALWFWCDSGKKDNWKHAWIDFTQPLKCFFPLFLLTVFWRIFLLRLLLLWFSHPGIPCIITIFFRVISLDLWIFNFRLKTTTTTTTTQPKLQRRRMTRPTCYMFS